MLTLYRGDFEKISKFEFTKTKKNCLFGQGIYLTDNETVADSYRDKGAIYSRGAQGTMSFGPKGKYIRLFYGQCRNRNEAMEKAFQTYCEDFYYDIRGQVQARRVSKSRIQELAKEQFNTLIQEGQIKAEYVNYLGRANRKELVRKEAPLYTIEVSYTREKGTEGYISQFAFNEVEIQNTVIRIERSISDHLFWEIAKEHKIDFDKPYDKSTENSLLQSAYVFSRWGDPNQRISHTRRNFELLQKHYPQYGYRGLEYHGGVRVGGYGQHRAFVMWDEDWVNAHKVKRYR